METPARRLPLTEAEGETKLLSSIFIARVFPLSNLEEFKEKEEAFKKAHPKADHYPYCLIVDNLTRSSDDGEPGGSSGRPMLSLLQSKGIVNAGLIVARYFGGSKLGIPRLRRCMLEASENAIASAKFGIETKRFLYELEVDYATFDRLQSLASKGEFEIEVKKYDFAVSLTLLSGAKIDSLLEKRGIFLLLPKPQETIIIEEESRL